MTGNQHGRKQGHDGRKDSAKYVNPIPVLKQDERRNNSSTDLFKGVFSILRARISFRKGTFRTDSGLHHSENGLKMKHFH